MSSLRESLFKDPDKLDLTDGSIGKTLFYLSIPIILTNLLQTAYNLADTIWLGQYSTESLAAISFSFPLVFLIISVGIGISIAGSVMVAQQLGSGNRPAAERIASQTISLATISSLLVGTFGYYYIESILTLLGATGTTLTQSVSYMQIISLGIPTLFGLVVFNALMRGNGDTLTPLAITAISVSINLILDPILIFGITPFIPELGIKGAAYATIFSRGIALIAGLYILFGTNRGITAHINQLPFSIAYLKQTARIGIPATLEITGRAISFNALLIVVAWFSTDIIAAYGIGTRMFTLMLLPAVAVSNAVETVTAQNLGAGNSDRALKTNHFAAKTLSIILTIAGLLITIFRTPIVSIFTPDPAVVSLAGEFMLFVAFTFGAIGISRAYVGGFRGSGRTIISAIIAIPLQGGARFTLAYLLAMHIGHTGIWLAFAISNVFGALCSFIWFRYNPWNTKHIQAIVNKNTPTPTADD